MRDIIVVIANIQDKIPDGYREAWENSFDRLIDDVSYTAPEAMGIRWGQLGELVEMIVGQTPHEDWQFDVIGELMHIDPIVARDMFGGR